MHPYIQWITERKVNNLAQHLRVGATRVSLQRTMMWSNPNGGLNFKFIESYTAATKHGDVFLL
jgi:hypothetical protein